jgi:hypothetical protein
MCFLVSGKQIKEKVLHKVSLEDLSNRVNGGVFNVHYFFYRNTIYWIIPTSGWELEKVVCDSVNGKSHHEFRFAYEETESERKMRWKLLDLLEKTENQAKEKTRTQA